MLAADLITASWTDGENIAKPAFTRFWVATDWVEIENGLILDYFALAWFLELAGHLKSADPEFSDS